MLDNYAGATPPGTFTLLQIHIGDAYATTWGSARDTYYSVTGTPTAEFDGVQSVVGAGSVDSAYTAYMGKYNLRQAVATDVTIQLTGTLLSGSTYEVQAEVGIEASGTGKTLRIYLAQVLDHYPVSPSYSRYCFIQAATTHGAEDLVTLSPGEFQTVTRNFTFSGPSLADLNNVKIVAWAQASGSDKNIWQAATMSWPFPESVALKIELPDAVPEYIPPGTPTDITVQIEDGAEAYVPGSGLLHYRYAGGTYLTSSLTALGGDLYKATLPAPACGDTPQFYISAQGDEGTTIYSPEDAPTSVYTTGVATVTTVLDDNFETDQGWTVVTDAGCLGGAWQRAVPIPCSTPRGDPPADFDGSGKCFLTQNNTSATLCNTDVDGGWTRLISPTLDMAGMQNPLLRFAYWWRNDDQDSDPYLVEVSNDNGANWVTIHTFVNPPEPALWQTVEYNLTSYITMTSTMKLRFSVADIPNNSLDEGALDAVKIIDVVCGAVATGACCQPNGTCTVATQADCTGSWQGADTLCTPNLCPGFCTTCRSDVNRDGFRNGKDVQNFVDCAVAGGAISQPCACADMDENGIVNMADLDSFVTTLLNSTGQCPP